MWPARPPQDETLNRGTGAWGPEATGGGEIWVRCIRVRLGTRADFGAVQGLA